MSTAYRDTTDTAVNTDIRHSEALLKAGALQSAIFNSANFSSIGTDAKGVIVVMALNEHPDTARIPILVVTAKEITSGDRAKLSGHVSTIMGKAECDGDRFTIEVRRAMFGRRLVA